MSQDLFDYVIVGAGAAGCVLAARLAADRATRVLLLEAGGPDRNPLIAVPGANVVTGTMPALNWSDLSAPTPEINGRSLYWAQGRVLGGSSSINGMMYARGRAADYDGWRDAGCPGWSYDDVLPYFKKSETNARGETAVHGGHGPLRISRGQATSPICDLFLEAARESGLPVVDDLNDTGPEAFGHVDLALSRGRRSSTASAYLRGLRPGPNLQVRTGVVVSDVIVTDGRATGVNYIQHGQARSAQARLEVILSAGAINTPQILLNSGIGPAADLTRAGIAVRVDAPEVGENLQNHPMYRLMYQCSAPVTAYSHVSGLGAFKAGANYLFARRGPLASGLFPTGGFIEAEPGDADTTLQISMAPALVIRRGPGVLGILPRRHGFTVLLNQSVPYSRGRVTLGANPATDRPIIAPNYFSEPRDLDILARGAMRIRAMMQAPALARVIEAEIQPQGPIDGLDDLKADIRATCVTHYHAVGTCRMGSDARSVVDPDLRVRGVTGLRVADASIMPTIICGSTFAPTVMIAEKASDIIQETRP